MKQKALFICVFMVVVTVISAASASAQINLLCDPFGCQVDYALIAQTAWGLQCSGCVSKAELNFTPGTVTQVITGTGLTGGPITGSGTISLGNTSVTPGSYTRGNFTVDAQGRLTAASSGAVINLGSEVTGVLPISSGGTGTSSSPSVAGQYLRSSGANVWGISGIQAADLPSLSGSYVDLTTDQTVGGNKTFTGALSAANLTTTGNITLPVTTATKGIIMQGGEKLIHTYPGNDGGNFFAGINAGNLTMTGSYNTATGPSALFSNTSGTGNTVTGVQALRYNTSGSYNTAMGLNALYSNTTGSANTATGRHALFANTTAGLNTAVGFDALHTQSFDNGGSLWNSHNTAVGYNALYSNQPTSINNGVYNTAVGSNSLRTNKTGQRNTALGYGALYSNTTGSYNTATGSGALYFNTTAGYNTVVGYNALSTQSFDNGGTAWQSHNTAVGYQALYSNQPTSTDNGTYNTAVGSNSLWQNSTGQQNTALGYYALYMNTTGDQNVAVGFRALEKVNGTGNSALGFYAGSARSSGSNNTFLGTWTDAASEGLTNATAVGNGAIVDDSNKVVIGNTSVLSIGGYTGWSNFSDLRSKTDIQDMGYGLDLIRNLRPVSFRMKNGNGRTDFGFIAQEIEALLGDGYNVLDIGGGEERMLSLRYTQLIAPMVKAMQEQQGIIEEQREKIRSLEERLARLEALVGSR